MKSNGKQLGLAPINTEYRHIPMRSKSEAIFALAIDYMTLSNRDYQMSLTHWIYEPHFLFESKFNPDFVLLNDELHISIAIEYKPVEPTPTYIRTKRFQYESETKQTDMFCIVWVDPFDLDEGWGSKVFVADKITKNEKTDKLLQFFCLRIMADIIKQIPDTMKHRFDLLSAIPGDNKLSNIRTSCGWLYEYNKIGDST